MSETGNRMTVETKPESASPVSADGPVDPGRRGALVKLGLAVGVAYATPMIFRLDRAANAAILPAPCPPSDGNCGNNPASCPC
jgi:hypothetical protein